MLWQILLPAASPAIMTGLQVALPISLIVAIVAASIAVMSGLPTRSLLKSGGASLREFLLNLPDFHARVALLYPQLQPPEFTCTDVTETSLRLHYFTARPGLTDFVDGLLQGLSKLYETPISIRLTASRADGADHDIFDVSWGAPEK